MITHHYHIVAYYLHLASKHRYEPIGETYCGRAFLYSDLT